jgi:hypothetical protein
MNNYLYPQKAARSLRRRSLLGLLGAAPLTAAAVPAARAMASTGPTTPAPVPARTSVDLRRATCCPAGRTTGT